MEFFKFLIFLIMAPKNALRLSTKNVNSMTRDRFQTGLNPCFSITQKFVMYAQVIGQIITGKISNFHIF